MAAGGEIILEVWKTFNVYVTLARVYLSFITFLDVDDINDYGYFDLFVIQWLDVSE